MRALVLERPGPQPRLAIRDIPLPQVSGDRVLVRVEACGLCYHDVLVTRGILRRGVKDGIVLGHEISGVVEGVGPEVEGLRVGDRVASIQTDACGSCDRCVGGLQHRCIYGRGIGHSIDGGFAEYVSLRAASLVKIPPELDFTNACLLGCPMGVVQRAVTKAAKIVPGERVMVTGAGGGLGAHGVQLARATGAEVYAITRSESKASALEGLGADHVVCVGELDFAEVILALTEDSGVDVTLDTVGSPIFSSTLRCLGQYGRLVLLGEVEGAEVCMSLAEIIFRDASILGSSGAGRDDLQSAFELVMRGEVQPVVAGHFSLEQWREAWGLMAEGAHVGRVVLTPTT